MLTFDYFMRILSLYRNVYWEQGAEENMWTQGKRTEKKTEKSLLKSFIFVLFTNSIKTIKSKGKK
jgi:hypothetical protein